MTRILLIRHGNTDVSNLKLCGRLPGIPLSAAGVHEVDDLARYLSKCRQVNAIYSSPLERTQQTASRISAMQNMPCSVQTDERLTEMDFGDWTGQSFHSLQLSEDWRHYNANRSLHAAPGGESVLQVQARAWSSISDLVRKHPEETLAIVTHADVIRALLVLFLGMPLDFLLRLQVAPASLSEVVVGGDYPVVSCVNFVCSPDPS